VATNLFSAFADSACRVFDMMAGIQFRVHPVRYAPVATCGHELNAIVPVQGRWSGAVVVGVDPDLSLLFTEQVLGCRPATIDDDVIDTVKELGNMIVGQVEGSLPTGSFRMSLPTVVIGAGTGLGFGSEVNPVLLPLSCSVGKMSLLFGLVDATPDGSLLIGQEKTATAN
jgi:chemotaxis protein CheX